jgi:hypothetical protein
VVDSYGLLGSSLHQLNENIGAINGAFGNPSVLEIDDDDGYATVSSTQGSSMANATLSASISGLSQVSLAAAKMEAEQHEKNRLTKRQTTTLYSFSV